MSKTLKRRPDKSATKTPDSEQKFVKKRKPLVLSSDSSLEDARAPNSVPPPPEPARNDGDVTDVPVDESDDQFLNGDANPAPSANNAVADDLENEIDDLEAENDVDDDDNMEGVADDDQDDGMEVDNDLEHLPFHNSDL